MLKIDDPETVRLAHQLAKETGETLTEAVTVAIRERLSAVRRKAALDDLAEIQAFVASLPVRDARTPEEMLGYDEFGLPK